MLSKDHQDVRAMPVAATTKSEAEAAIAARACRFIETSLAEAGPGEGNGAPTLAELGRHCRLSPWHLQRLFARVMGVSPREYADALRLGRLRAGLRGGEGVAAATFDAGFGSSSRVYERAGPLLGMTPATYAKGGRGAAIAYALAASPLGRLLVAATAKGVCFVAVGDNDARLEAALRREFPAALSLQRGGAALGQAIGAILAHLAGRAPRIELPLDIRATAFQRQVWQALARIPLGETRSYADIAAALGRPRAQRAVGQACARNPVALVVPCHRVLRADGDLGGYRWGRRLKKTLLAHEKARAGFSVAADSRACAEACATALSGPPGRRYSKPHDRETGGPPATPKERRGGAKKTIASRP
jgi:AraC family transcriptional regulator of adaptative response/methylated-DNA-[protein]-cysteine methyltransferase